MFKRTILFVDEVIIDEYQDLTVYDFSVLKSLAKQEYFDVFLIGDVYQASVQRSCRRGRRIQIVKYHLFILMIILSDLCKNF